MKDPTCSLLRCRVMSVSGKGRTGVPRTPFIVGVRRRPTPPVWPVWNSGTGPADYCGNELCVAGKDKEWGPVWRACAKGLRRGFVHTAHTEAVRG